MRSIKELENFSPDMFFYPVKEAAANYVTMKLMNAYDKTDAARNEIHSVEDFLAYQQRVKKIFKDSMGDIPYAKTHPLNDRITGKIEEEDLTIEKIIFETRENVYVTANLYLPKERDGKCAAVLLQCGHSNEGKVFPAYQRAARIIARAGIIVLVIDPPEQGERISYIEGKEITALLKRPTERHQQFGHQCFLAGENPAKYFLADALKAVDYLCARPEVDSERIGATGISGGGTFTSALMIIDDRIKAAAPGCWPNSGREYYFGGTSPDSEQVWPDVLKNGLDHYEIMAGMCPRPLMILAAEEDFLPIEGTKRLFEECRRFWELNGCGDKIQLTVGEGGHGYSVTLAKAAAKFFRDHLCVKKGTLQLEDINTVPEKVLTCTKAGRVKNEFESSVSVFEENLRQYERNRMIRPPYEERCKKLYERVYNGRSDMTEFHLRHFDVDMKCEAGMCADPFMWFTQSMMPCYGILFKASCNMRLEVPVTICLWQGGTDSLVVNMETIRSICRAGGGAFVVDLSAMGKCTPNPPLRAYDAGECINGAIDRLSKRLITLGDSLCAIKAFDLMQTIKMLREKLNVKDIEIYAKGKYAVFARIIEMLDEQVGITVQDEVSVRNIISNEYYDTYDTAHILMPGLGNYLD